MFRTIRDREIYFVEMPEQVTVTRQIQFDVDEVNPIYDEIVKLLEKRSIKKDIQIKHFYLIFLGTDEI